MIRDYALAVSTVLSCVGYGLGIGRVAGIRGNLGDAGVLGLFCVAVLGCVIHFFTALDSVVQVGVLSAGILLAALLGRDLITLSKEKPLSILVGFSAFFHPQVLTFYDTGLYHLQTFLWNKQAPLTVGLGNLHGRLAFNSTLFLIAPLDDHVESGWISNLVILVFVLMSCHARLSLVKRHSVEFWFLTLAVVTLAIFPRQLQWAGVLNADGFGAVLIIYWISILLSFPASFESNIKLLLLTAAFGVTIKLSLAPLLLVSVIILWRSRNRLDGVPYAAIGLAGILLGLWTLRGLLLSGCAVYPVPQSCIARFPWTVSSFQVTNEFEGIRSWARTPHRLDYEHVLGNWNWVGPWAIRSLGDWSARLLLAGIAAAMLSLLLGSRTSRTVVVAATGLSISLLYWFFTAPEVRFGSGFLAAGGLLGLSVACASYFGYFRDTVFVKRLILEAIALSVIIGVAGVTKSGNSWTINARPDFQRMTGPDGKSVWVPQEVDQCWDHPLPCTPYFDEERLKRVRWR